MPDDHRADHHNAYRQTVDEVLSELATSLDHGLNSAEVRRRADLYGGNVLETTGGRSLFDLLTHQFKDLLIAVLCVAAALSWYLGDLRGATVLLAIILCNAAIGLYQEFKAERLLERLKSMIQARATVIRDGERVELDAQDLVPGDVVVLEAGDAVPADLRLIESFELATNDFMLTGESVPQDKDASLVLDGELALSERDNLVFTGTTVARGSARGVVIATGMRTAIGDIAQTGQTIQRDISPLQREMNALAGLLTRLAGVIALAMFVANLMLRHDAFADWPSLINASILFAIGVAAACVPQGLPAQITVALSLGVGRLARQNAVVKRLSAVETLGCTSVICSDKTGTMTTNQMTIVRAWVAGRCFDITGSGYAPEGQVLENGQPVSIDDLVDLKLLFSNGVLASNGRTHEPDETHQDWYAIGDPTEAAFMPLAMKAGLQALVAEGASNVIAELPFDSRRKRMTIVRSQETHALACMKGATPSVLEVCSAYLVDGQQLPLSDAVKASITAQMESFSGESLRVIALAYRRFPPDQREFGLRSTEQDFVFLGLVAMMDPPRSGVRGALEEVRDAQVRVFMLTGDDPITAAAIAQRVGMPVETVLTGQELHRLSEAELSELLSRESLILSRVSPQDKFRIVKALKGMGEVVAVTGDGVNDTLSLKRADIGVAMGRQGSDVAKEAAEIVLTDDDFATLVVAVREGRTIFQNLRSVILSSITSNIGELACVCLGFIGAAMGLPIPITAVQILSIDLIGEMLPLMALTFDPPEESLMKRPPRRLGAHIIDRPRLMELGVLGVLMGAGGYFSFLMVLHSGGTPAMAQAAAFVGIVLCQYMNILSRRSAGSIFARHLFANRPLWMALLASGGIVALIVGTQDAGAWFGFQPLRAGDWLWPILSALIYLGCFELRKLWRPQTAAQ